MNKPALYSRASEVQRHDAKEIAREYAPTMRLNSIGKQSLLDVGTGSGDVLMEVLVPELARGFTNITGIDISSKMVEFAAKTYGQLQGVTFKELDIEGDHLPLEFYHQFDRVTSFYCLHWIRNQRRALENIFLSLRSNGDGLLVFPGAKTTSEVYKMMAKKPRWKHLKDMSEIFSPLLEHPQIEKEFSSLLSEVGFIDWRVEMKNRAFPYEGVESFKQNMKAVEPFDLSDSEFEEYFAGMCDCFDALGLREKIPGKDDYRFTLKLRLVVAYVKKG